ncbi:MAG: nucleoside triphosphate pyrophosphohydrolase [Bacteriovoracaceae bacterium]
MNYPELEKLIATVTALRHPTTGCPWDLKQSHQSLTKYLVEESYEFIHEVEKQNVSGMKEELGDVLLQVLLHSVIAEQAGNFKLEEVAKTLNDKLIERHPHVFGEVKTLTPEQVTEQWGEIKKKTKTEKVRYLGEKETIFPALMSAEKIGKKTNDIKFDWDKPSQVSYKVEEEWQELKEEIVNYPQMNKNRVEEELGDTLFSLAQLARHLKIDPEVALRKANLKFIRRFNIMEDLIEQASKDIKTMNQEEMDHFWLQVKVKEKEQAKK